MSQHIICKECQFVNPTGSKFCNNCGNKLPLGTHIICFNCGTSNPIDRIFCDHCGTRLIAEEPRTEEKPKEEKPSGKAAFSLPARKPGETGDLDPRNVPDWLKTGKHGQGSDDDEDEGAPRRIEEITRKKHTDDLPDWLMDEDDSDPIIHAPTIISTEFYKGLLETPEDPLPQTDDLFPENDADLPDWLKETGAPPKATSPSKPPSPKREREEEKGLTDWLGEMAPEPKTPLPPIHQKQEAEPSLTSWLSSHPEEAEEEWPITAEPDSEGLTEWLSVGAEEKASETSSSVNESLTSWLSEFPGETADEDNWPVVEELDSGGLTGWFTTEEQKPVTEAPSDVHESLTDWFGTEVEKPVTEAPSDIHESLTGWLSEFPDEEETADEWPITEKSDSDRLTDWFASEPETPVTKAASSVQESLTGWLADEPDTAESEEVWPVVEEPDSGGLTAWLSESEEAEAVVDEPVDEEWNLSDRLTSWLAEEGEGTAADTTTDQADEAPFDWFLEDDELTDEADDFSEPEIASEPAFDEAARLAAWFSGEVAAEPAEEQFDWLVEPETSAVSSATQAVPEDLGWIDETEEELASIFQSQPGIEEDLPDWLAGVAIGDTPLMTAEEPEGAANLEDIFSAERKAATSEIDFLMETGSLRLDDETLKKLGLGEHVTDDMFADTILSDEPDWLAALSAVGITGPALPEVEEPDTAVPHPFLAEISHDETSLSKEAAVLDDLEMADDWEAGDLFTAVPAEEEALPDWISQLDATGPLPDEEELIPSDALPNWVASLRPSQDMADSVLPGALRPDMSEMLAGIPAELAGSDLPDWLNDIPRDSPTMPSIPMPADTQLSDIPDWLQPGLTLEEADSELFADPSGGTLDMTGVSDEWTAILNDLPPVSPLEEMLPKAEIPDWVMALKPAELTGAAPKVETGPEETFGPLSGLRGVVTIEPVIALPRVAGALQQFTVSPEQQQQVALLRQLAQNGQVGKTAVTAKAGRDISAWIRPLFALILITAVAIGLRGVVPLTLPGDVPPALSGVRTAVNEAAGQNVLVAFEYTPAMAGELTPEAQMLLAQLAEHDSPVLTISQYPAGSTIAEEIAGSAATHLGYLPGGAIGLRRLGECLSESTSCEESAYQTLFGRRLTDEQRSELQDVALIIILTADQQSLVNWIEQVGTAGERPLIAGVTQALAPMAAPYFGSQQLAGVLNGIPGTAVYQQEFLPDSETTVGDVTAVQSLFSAQVTAQMLLIVVLILGALVYLISGILERRRPS